MKQLIFTAFALLFVISVPLAAMAFGNCGVNGPSFMNHKGRGAGMEGRRGGGFEGQGRLFRLPGFYLAQAKDLGLSDDQKSALEKMSTELKKDIITKGAALKVGRLELRELLAKQDYTQDDAAAKLMELSDERLALETSLLQYAVQARNVLTPDQLKAVKDFRGRGRCAAPGDGMGRQDLQDDDGE